MIKLFDKFTKILIFFEYPSTLSLFLLKSSYSLSIPLFEGPHRLSVLVFKELFSYRSAKRLSRDNEDAL